MSVLSGNNDAYWTSAYDPVLPLKCVHMFSPASPPTQCHLAVYLSLGYPHKPQVYLTRV